MVATMVFRIIFGCLALFVLRASSEDSIQTEADEAPKSKQYVAVNIAPQQTIPSIVYLSPPEEPDDDNELLWLLLFIWLDRRSKQTTTTTTTVATPVPTTTTTQETTTFDFTGWSDAVAGCRYRRTTAELTYSAARDYCRDEWNAQLAYVGIKAGQMTAIRAAAGNGDVYIQLDNISGRWQWGDESTDGATSTDIIWTGSEPAVGSYLCAVIPDDGTKASTSSCDSSEPALCEICP